MKVCENWKKYKIVPAALFSAFYIFLVWYKSGIYFETNDDRYIASILSGVITGSPNAYVANANYLFSLPLYFLYKISYHAGVTLPWYGMSLIFFHWLSYMLILDAAYTKCKKLIHAMIASVMTGVFCISYYYMLGQIQYTSTAMLLIMTGYFALIIHGNCNTKKAYAVFFVCELLGCLLRVKAMLILQPMGLAVWVILKTVERNGKAVERIKKAVPVVAVLFTVAIVSMCGSLAGGYYYGELRSYMVHDNIRVKMFDYYGKPDYLEVKDILDKYNVSENEYNAYLNYTVFKSNITLDCEKELAEYASKDENNRISDALNGIKSIYLEDYQWNINRFSICAFIALIILIIVYGKYYLLIPSLGLAAAQVLTWGVLFYRGRVLMRVTAPVFACSALLSMALVIECISGDCSRGKNILRRTAAAVCCAILIFTGLSSARQQYRYVHEVNEGQSVFMEGMYEIIAYCEAHGDNRYILESVSMGNYKGSALENGIYHPSNYVFSGGWFSNMPDVKEHMETYLNETEDMYLIIYSDGNEAEHPSVKYLEEYTGKDAEEVDSIVTSPGGIYTVYRF